MSLFDAVAQWLAVPYLLDRYGGAAPERVGLAHPGICPYGVFTAQCGQDFVLSVQNEREWERLCEMGIARADLLHDERCADNQTRVANRDFVDDAVRDAVARLAYTEVQERFEKADLAFAPVNNISKLKSHSDFHTVPVTVGETTVELPRVPGAPWLSERLNNVPELGAHTQEILARVPES